MKKSFLCSLCFCLTGMALLSSCDLITTKKEKEQMMREAQMQRETDRKIAYDRKKNDRDRAWLDQHQDIADKLVIDFVNNKGYSMQAFRVVKRSASDGSFVVSYDSKLPSTIQTATYDLLRLEPPAMSKTAHPHQSSNIQASWLIILLSRPIHANPDPLCKAEPA